MRRTLPWASSLALWLINAGAMIALYGRLPQRMAMHWDLWGRPDGWGSPALMLGSLALSSLAAAVVAVLAQREASRQAVGRSWSLPLIDALQGFFLGVSLCLWNDPSPSVRLRLPFLLGGVLAAVAVSLAARWLAPVPEAAKASPLPEIPIASETLRSTESGRAWSYREGQDSWWLRLLLLGLLGWALWILVRSGLAGLLPALPGTFFAALFWGGFHVVADRRGVHLRLGPLGIPIRNLSWQEIRTVRLREFSPLAEFGGWGLRYRPGTTALFLRGRRGAEIVIASGRSWLVGSDHPERLCEVLEAARKAHAE
jgi:hypothetical protein